MRNENADILQVLAALHAAEIGDMVASHGHAQSDPLAHQRLAAALLGEGMSSPLMDQLREQHAAVFRFLRGGEHASGRGAEVGQARVLRGRAEAGGEQQQGRQNQP